MDKRSEQPFPQAELFDEAGFLLDPVCWDRELAGVIARDLGIERLSDAHWRIIDCVREHYQKNRTLPVIHLVCREQGLQRGCVTDLFGHDLTRMWRIAGLPNPGEEARAYMHDM
jgi:tRNA 2-thiouridine synthesizing protein E